MLRVQFDINGRDIAEIGVHNTGETIRGVTKYNVYDLHDFDGNRITEAPLITSVYHGRSDGARELGARVLDEISDEHFN